MLVSCVYVCKLLMTFIKKNLKKVQKQVAEFQPLHTVRKYFTSAFQAFYTRRRRSYSKVFMYLKFLKIICEEVNL